MGSSAWKPFVETSIEQMRAYGELVAAVAKTADEYMAENIGMGQGRGQVLGLVGAGRVQHQRGATHARLRRRVAVARDVGSKGTARS